MDKLNQTITAEKIKKYLINNGWKQEENFPNKNLMVFRLGNHRIAIPSSESLDDFHVGVKAVLPTLALFHKKTLPEVKMDIALTKTKTERQFL